MTVSTLPAHALPKPKPDLTATRKPQSPIAIFFWRRRIWFESTFVSSMLEPWEKILLCALAYRLLIPSNRKVSDYFLVTILFASVVLVVTGIYKYLPQQIFLIRRRAIYYLWGQEGDERLLWQWLGLDVDPSPGIYKES
ncbi:hypothetical protein J132_00921 [Termitomyces sp. J132]|nr:hypothetical protein J132_00921 [Termitomyces sp. J132]